MTLIRTTFLNAIAVTVKIVSLLALNKILAILVGPAGYAMIGQVQNAVTMMTAVASAGVTTGVTKYTAEYWEENQRQHQVWQTAARLGAIGSLLVGSFIIALNVQVSQFVLQTPVYGPVFILVGLCLILCVFNMLLLAILNGKKAIGLFVSATVATSVLSLVITAVLAWRFGLEGALIALALNQSASFLVTLWLCRREEWFSLSMLWGPVDPATFKKLLAFTLMALCTSAIGPACQIMIRNQLIADFGVNDAGYWEALIRMSNLYLMFLTTPLSVYYLPRMAELQDKSSQRREMAVGYMILIPAACVMALILYLIKDWLIPFLFAESFLPLTALMKWQFFGDVLRVCAWLLSFFLISKAMTQLFIITEVSFNLLLVFLTKFLTQTSGLAGAPQAYTISYGLYVIVMGIVVWQLLSDRPSIKV